ncbi:uncharacterized protein LOC123291670 [Chrysoperla carnea]|uniref:uncharacterized protein LOC123291670 n=1 Tax=Chrysoperla carnea TaxID=189513 RepID=UPI001D06DFA5|nr:uncharacterized protein LOC123291670 [Chrysoperla carnea]
MYNFQNMISNKRPFNLWKFYLSRYFRIFPVVITVFLFYITLGKFCEHGVYHPDNLHDIEVWREYAWSQFICIANFFLESGMSFSLAHLWYVHCDSQLYLFTPIVFLFYLKFSKKTSLVFMFLALFISICTVFIVGYLITYQYTVVSAEYSALYKMPYFRANPWILGLICAHFYIQMIKSPLKLNKMFFEGIPTI